MAKKTIEIKFSDDDKWKTTMNLYYEFLLIYFRQIEISPDAVVSEIEEIIEDLAISYWQIIQEPEYHMGRRLFEEKMYPQLQLLRQKYRSTSEKRLFESWIVEQSPHALQ